MAPYRACTIRVRYTASRHVPYGSMFFLYRRLRFEYAFTVDVPNELPGSSRVRSQKSSILLRLSASSAKRLHHTVTMSSVTAK